ncbi:Ephrin-A3 [Goodea atripinnis]|uniref:Ephrin-A3 n=1 Tax=Goodea atripinnis TaxID=208336 RepID=A0ABV0MZ07_9TELE
MMDRYDCVSVSIGIEELMLRREGYTVQVSVNDYLDIYCPHYNTSQRGTLERVVAEQYILYMVNYRGYYTCNPQMGVKRWECNRPHAPHTPIKFSEKFQRYSAFSLGYEFTVGQEYYYICESLAHCDGLKTPEDAQHPIL